MALWLKDRGAQFYHCLPPLPPRGTSFWIWCTYMFLDLLILTKRCSYNLYTEYNNSLRLILSKAFLISKIIIRLSVPAMHRDRSARGSTHSKPFLVQSISWWLTENKFSICNRDGAFKMIEATSLQVQKVWKIFSFGLNSSREICSRKWPLFGESILHRLSN